jgi:aspartate aminotransferase
VSIDFAARVSRIKPSPTLTLTAQANALKAQGKDIVALTAGEPDFVTPDEICQAAIKAIQSGDTHYTAVDGTKDLKDAIIEKLERDNGLSYAPEEILVSCGAKHSIYNLLAALINDDGKDEVIIPAPYWVSYPDMVQLCGGKPVIVETTSDSRHKILPDQLEKAITKNTKLLFLNTPSNPTGMAYSEAELQALGEVLKRHPDVWIMSDDIYEHILWNGQFSNIAMACPELKSRTIVINGVSKAYAMTGWRIGFAAGNADLLKAMKKIQSQSTSNPCSVSQAAAAAAFRCDQSVIAPMIEAFKTRHDSFVAALNTIDGITCEQGDGAFYAFANVSKMVQAKGLSSCSELAEKWLEAGIAAVPGSAFGANGFMRLSFATSEENLNKAIEKLKAFSGQ